MKPRYYALIAVAAAVSAGVVLFVTAQKVQMSDANLRHLQTETLREKQALHVLHAEWDYLNRPDRLEALAKAHLNMVPPQAGEIVPKRQKLEAGKSEAGNNAAVPATPAPPGPDVAVQHNFQTMLDTLNKDARPAGKAPP